MAQIELQAKNRIAFGNKVRTLRREGMTPVNVFGRSVESAALQCETLKLEQILHQAGETRLISIKINGDEAPRMVLVSEVQRDPVSGRLLHVAFHQVEMKEKVEVEVPVVLAGKAPALEVKENNLLRELNTLTVECLPADIPTAIEVNISGLKEVGDTVRVKDIKVAAGVTVLNEPEQIVALIVKRAAEKVEEKVVAPTAEAAAPVAPAPATEEETKEK